METGIFRTLMFVFPQKKEREKGSQGKKFQSAKHFTKNISFWDGIFLDEIVIWMMTRISPLVSGGGTGASRAWNSKLAQLVFQTLDCCSSSISAILFLALSMKNILLSLLGCEAARKLSTSSPSQSPITVKAFSNLESRT